MAEFVRVVGYLGPCVAKDVKVSRSWQTYCPSPVPTPGSRGHGFPLPTIVC
jgi:hypothetical protein